MWWASAIQAGMSLFGAMDQKRAGKEARAIANMNAEAQRMESAEDIRRTKAQFRQVEGATQAVASGSGFSQKLSRGGVGDSQQRYLASMKKEHGAQLDFAKKAGTRQERILRRGGQLAYQQAKAGAIASVGNAIGSFGDMWGMIK